MLLQIRKKCQNSQEKSTPNKQLYIQKRKLLILLKEKEIIITKIDKNYYEQGLLLMKVVKFGGSWLALGEQMKRFFRLLFRSRRKIVVVSARVNAILKILK